MNFEYDCGYGAAEINQELKIIGQGWWFERYEYDGSEQWEYRETINKDKLKIGEVTLLEKKWWED
jgi:hypothetical protein